MGPTSTFGVEDEKKLSNHVEMMQKRGFPFTIKNVRVIAYQFAEQLHVKHKFNNTEEMAS